MSNLPEHVNIIIKPLIRELLERLKSMTGKDGSVFRVTYSSFYHTEFLPALKAAEIENFPWHSLRHTFASRLVMKGVPINSVSRLMGHSTIAMTDRYTHLGDDFLRMQ
jgi:integrase